MFFTSATPGGQKTLSQVTCPRWFCLTQFNLIQHQKKRHRTKKSLPRCFVFPKNNPCPVFFPRVFEFKIMKTSMKFSKQLTQENPHKNEESFLMVPCRTSKAPDFGYHHRVALLMSSEVHDGENHSKSDWKWKDLSWNPIISRWILPNMARLFRKPQKTCLWMGILKDVFFVSGRPIDLQSQYFRMISHSEWMW